MRCRVIASGWLSALAVGAVVAGSPPALSQTMTAEAKPDADLVPQATPDPLTPAKIEASPLMAPGAPATATTIPTQADAIITDVRRQLDAPAATASADRPDRAALKSYYTEGTGRAIWTSTSGFTKHGTSAIAEMTDRAADYGLDRQTFAHLASLKAEGDVAAQAEVEIKIGLAVLKYARHARGGRVDPQAISKVIDREAQLYEPRSVLEAIAASDEPDAYLRTLHPGHQQFARLRQALLKLRAGGEQAASLGLKGMSTSDAENRILINMERWRWLPDDMGEMHVWNNVPEQLTRIVRDGKTLLTERIVVGKPDHQTPEFSAPMKYVIFHPSWGVPDGIKTNEIGPMLRRASARNDNFGWLFGESEGAATRALKRHELRIMQNGREVNPDKINWATVDPRQFQFTQPPSGKNVLGVVKFRFPNKFDVYMHDTQDKQLFAHGTRAYSHGCMRVQNPLRVAEVILSHDKGWSAEKVNAFVPRGATADITLDKRINVHNTYFTAAVDEDGKLKSYGDIYGRDGRLASALAGKSVSLAPIAIAQPAKPAKAAEAGATDQKGKRKSGQRVKTARDNGGEAFDPFGRISAN